MRWLIQRMKLPRSSAQGGTIQADHLSGGGGTTYLHSTEFPRAHPLSGSTWTCEPEQFIRPGLKYLSNFKMIWDFHARMLLA